LWIAVDQSFSSLPHQVGLDHTPISGTLSPAPERAVRVTQPYLGLLLQATLLHRRRALTTATYSQTRVLQLRRLLPPSHYRQRPLLLSTRCSMSRISKSRQQPSTAGRVQHSLQLHRSAVGHQRSPANGFRRFPGTATHPSVAHSRVPMVTPHQSPQVPSQRVEPGTSSSR